MVLERINDKRVSVLPYAGEVLAGSSGWDPSPVADVESPYFLRLSRLAREVFPGALTAPFLVIGGTDSRHYASVTDNAFRFSRLSLTEPVCRVCTPSTSACRLKIAQNGLFLHGLYPGDGDTARRAGRRGSVADADDEDVQELIVDPWRGRMMKTSRFPTLEETMAFGEEDEADIEDNGDDSSAEEPA